MDGAWQPMSAPASNPVPYDQLSITSVTSLDNPVPSPFVAEVDVHENAVAAVEEVGQTPAIPLAETDPQSPPQLNKPMDVALQPVPESSTPLSSQSSSRIEYTTLSTASTEITAPDQSPVNIVSKHKLIRHRATATVGKVFLIVYLVVYQIGSPVVFQTLATYHLVFLCRVLIKLISQVRTRELIISSRISRPGLLKWLSRS